MGRNKLKVTTQIETFIRMEARGESRPAILKACFGLSPDDDERLVNNADVKMCRWRKIPEYKKIWEDELAATVRRHTGGAMKTILAQLTDNNGWLANKAANDVVTLAKNLGIVKCDDATAIRVQVTGMPDLGSPDQDEGEE